MTGVGMCTIVTCELWILSITRKEGQNSWSISIINQDITERNSQKIRNNLHCLWSQSLFPLHLHKHEKKRCIWLGDQLPHLTSMHKTPFFNKRPFSTRTEYSRLIIFLLQYLKIKELYHGIKNKCSNTN